MDWPTFPADVAADGALVFDAPRQLAAYCKAKWAGQRVDVEIRPRKAKRSDRQNRAFHAALVPWARELGYTAEELKAELLGLLWGTTERVSPLTGEVRQVLTKPHTSTLTTAEFAELFDFMALKAAETGYVMPMPEEFRAGRMTHAAS